MSEFIEVIALACFVVAGWMVAPALGLVVAGAALLLIAQAVDGVKVRVPKIRLPKVKVPRLVVPRPRIRRPGEQPAGEPA